MNRMKIEMRLIIPRNTDKYYDQFGLIFLLFEIFTYFKQSFYYTAKKHIYLFETLLPRYFSNINK